MPLTPARVLRTFRYGVLLDGVDDFGSVRDSPSLKPAVLTVGAWVNIPRYPTDWLTNKIVRKANEYSPYTGFWLDITPTTRTFRFSANSISTHYSVFGATVPALGRWYNPVGVFDGSRLYIYVNGVLDAPPVSGAYDPYDIDLWIGRFGNHYLNCIISEVFMYNRALSDEENWWNYENPDDLVADGLVLSLYAHPNNIQDIDNDGILEWIDLSGHGNHAKLYGARLVELVKEPARVLSPARVLAPAR